MIRTYRNRHGEIVSYGVSVYRDGERRWVGSFKVKTYGGARKARSAAETAQAEAKESRPEKRSMTCGEYATRFMAEYQRRNKRSSYDTLRTSLKPFLKRFARVPLPDVTRIEAKDFAHDTSASYVPAIVALFNAAVEDELLERNPFRGLGRRLSRGRADDDPPTEAELKRLLDACSVHGDYAPTMRALILFAAYSGMRPGELFELEWADIDFDRMRIDVKRRLYRGGVDLPKSNAAREISLLPPARDAILGLPRVDRLVFHSKRGRRLSEPTLSGYWAQVKARAGLDFAFYSASRHYCAHYLWVKLNLSERAVAEQLGHALDKDLRWKLRTVYGHGKIGALDEIDRAFEKNVKPLRPKAVGDE